MSDNVQDPDDRERGTVEGNLGAPRTDPRTAQLSAADAYARPQRGESSDAHIEVVIVETADDHHEDDHHEDDE
ncbi:hypothetical protein [Cellulomonas sp. KH9]|uniref:hypothetical protein n=1 Tax=Cellulomonas sp. KH9 TaxID=1855324 RepID=UPI0008E58E70|nr:hypothetical protein [Cellulomonas sp. KH9]SFK56213.1 hypothetical protein SAMN05216467_3788 [Cellulomonas sp. KH9]